MSPLPLLVGVGAAGSVVLLLVGSTMVRQDALSRLDASDLLAGAQPAHGSKRSGGPLDRLARRLAPSLRQVLGPRWIRRLQHQIDLAGRPDGLTVDGLLRRFVMWGVIVAPLVLLFLAQGELLAIGLCLGLVAVMPLARLARDRRLRRERLERDLPDFLDILAVTVTAGVAFRQALQRVSERFEGPLAQEIGLTLHQMAAGASLRESFHDLRQRAGSDVLAEFVSAFLQSEELGAPLAETLNQLAADIRRTSAQQLRRRAARAAPRVTLVTSLVLVPGALILVLVGLILGSDVDFGQLQGLGR